MCAYVHVRDAGGVNLFLTKKEYSRIKKKSYGRFKRSVGRQREKGLQSRKHKTSR